MLERLVALSGELAGTERGCSTLARMSKLDELVGAAREDVERRKRQVPLDDLRDAVGHAERRRARSARRSSAPGSR